MIFRIAPAFSTSTSFLPLLGFACSMPGKSKTYSEKMVVKNGDESHGTQEKNHLKQIQSTSCKKKSLEKNQSTKLKQTPIILNKLQELLSFPSGWSLIFFQPLCALPLYSEDPIYRPFEWWERPYFLHHPSWICGENDVWREKTYVSQQLTSVKPPSSGVSFFGSAMEIPKKTDVVTVWNLLSFFLLNII